MSSLLGWWSWNTPQGTGCKTCFRGSSIEDGPILTGTDSAECEGWIRSIQKEAFVQSKTADKAWMAGLASTRIAGRALRWYSQQSDDVTSDWTKLRAAVLDEYCAEAPARSAPNHSIMMPPPASGPADPGNGSWFSGVPFPPWKARAPPAPSGHTCIKGHVRVQSKTGFSTSTVHHVGYLYANYQTGTIFVCPGSNFQSRMVMRLNPDGITNGISVVVPVGCKESKVNLSWASHQGNILGVDSPEDIYYHCADPVLAKDGGHKLSPVIGATLSADGQMSICGSFPTSIATGKDVYGLTQ
ncbi:hypothetical protein M407DRAFT_234829 [Tulasnella calospora MUT 4182]|uniref:Uncharacterized protein n=1 Tax=Tulasnella calospora MUT 4182 TaxID=1051891 RepID=A0A0C3KYY9_9AGAM|nr:hypothetical protein M407DRAFT_234829 [Tulasnella calospora MUT 4182]